ncbi:MAG: Calx-beta domain-containing protein [Synechococcaceae cyanobacterium]
MTHSTASPMSVIEALTARAWAASRGDRISGVRDQGITGLGGGGGHRLGGGSGGRGYSATRRGGRMEISADWSSVFSAGSGRDSQGSGGKGSDRSDSGLGGRCSQAQLEGLSRAPVGERGSAPARPAPLSNGAGEAVGGSLEAALASVPSSHQLLQPSADAPCRCSVCSRLAVVDSAADSAAVAAAVAAAQTLPASPSGVLAASTFGSLTLADTFLLHSNPTASKRIFLDFDGYETTSSIWENGGALKVNPFYASFTDSVKLEIQRIWQRVAEDFAPFNVDVTTQDPGADRLINSGGSDSEWGIRMVFTYIFNVLSVAAITNAGGGGTAYLGSFDWSDGTPALGFNRGEYAAAETASHEVGHTLNLLHDATTTSSYYSGHGTGDTGWGAIMGASFIGNLENVTTWSNGEYYAANNSEDDLTIITTQNGFGYRSDDHGNSATAATVLNGSSFIRLGTISTTADSDWFRFETGAGNVSLSLVNANQAWVGSGGADPNAQTYSSTLLATRGPNLDIEARLYNASGALLAISNPVDLLTANFDISLSAGTYYLSVDGVGVGDPFSSTPTGYTDYASLGQYLLSGSVIEPIALVITPSGDPVTSEAGGSVSFAVQLSKQPSAAVTVLISSTKPTEGTANVSALSFDSGNWNTAQTIVVTGQDDTLVDGTVSYALVLDTSSSAAAEYAALPATNLALSNLDNDQPLLTLQSAAPAGSLQVLEGFDPSLAFMLNLSSASQNSVSVTLATINGTALAGSDYTALNQTVVFNPGETQKTVRVNLLNDNASEIEETFDVALSGAQNAKLGSSNRLTITISDTLRSAATTTLPSGVENLTLTGSDPINGSGNSGANIITGNSAANRLSGGGGLDVLTGLGGTDSFDLSNITTAANATTLTDFNSAGDAERILLSAAFTSVSGSGSPAIRQITSLANSRLTLDTRTGSGGDLFVVTPLMTEEDVNLANSTIGTALLDGLNSARGSVKLSTSTVGGKGYIAACNNGNTYLYAFNAGSDTSVVASEIQRIGILNSIGSNPFTTTNIQMI